MTLLLDPDIRDWVVLPLFAIMVMAGMLRTAMGQLLAGAPERKNVIVQRAQNKMNQASQLRNASRHYITTTQWNLRRQHFVKLLQDEALWCEQAEEKKKNAADGEDGDSNGAADADDPMSQMMNNPLSMMKGNMVFMVQK